MIMFRFLCRHSCFAVCIALALASYSSAFAQATTRRAHVGPGSIFRSVAPGKIWYSQGPAPVGILGWTINELRAIGADGMNDELLSNLGSKVGFAVPSPTTTGQWVFTYLSAAGWGVYKVTGALPKTDAELASATAIVAPSTAFQSFVVQLSPDGQMVYYTAVAKATSIGYLYSVPLAGGTPKVIDNNAYGLFQISQSGLKVAYTKADLTAQISYVFTANVDGSSISNVTPGATKAVSFANPGWSNSGEKLIVSGFNYVTGAGADLYTMSATGTDLKNVTNTPLTDEYMGAFSPDDTKIAYHRNRPLTNESYLVVAKVDGSNSTIIRGATEASFIGLVYWAPSKSNLTLTSLKLDPSSVLGGFGSTGTVSVSTGPNYSVTISLFSSDASAVVPASVVMPAGVTSVTFAVTTKAVTATRTTTITASGSGLGSVSADLLINPIIVDSLTFAKSTLTGGDSTTATVSINVTAPTGGAKVLLTSSNAVATVPANVTIPAGTKSTTFAITTTNPATDQTCPIKAAYGSGSKTTNLAVKAESILSLSVAPDHFPTGAAATATGHIDFAAAAPTGGLVITLTSDNAAVVVPATATLAEGLAGLNFDVTVKAVSVAATVNIKASWTTFSKSTTVTIAPISVSSITLDPTKVVGGGTSTGTVTITDPAQTGGFTVTLASADAVTAAPPTTVKVAQGAKTATFVIKTKAVGADAPIVITATAGGKSATATLTVLAPVLTAFTLDQTAIASSGKLYGTVTIAGVAPTSGITVKLSSSSAASISPPASVVVLSGKTFITFVIPVQTVTASVNVTLTATASSISKTASIRIVVPNIVELTVSPNTVVGGSATTVTGTVKLDEAAPPGGTKVTLKSSLTGAATVAGTVTVAAGATTATFPVTHKKVTAKATVTLTGTTGAVSKTATLTVTKA